MKTPPPEEYDDSWLDEMSLLAHIPNQEAIQQIKTFTQQITTGSPVRVLLGQIERTRIQEDMIKEIKKSHESQSLPVKATQTAEKKFFQESLTILHDA